MTYLIKSLGGLLMLGRLYRPATLLVLILIVTYNAPIFTTAIPKNTMKKNIMTMNINIPSLKIDVDSSLDRELEILLECAKLIWLTPM